MRAPRRDWSEQDSATLKIMRLAGQTAVAIGIALGGRGENTVRRAAQEMGLPRRPHKRAEFYARGRGYLAIARAEGRVHPVRKRQGKGRSQLLDAFPPVRFIDFDRLKQCHFIEGEPAGADTLMCGRPIAAGVYCAGHRAICVLPGVPDGR